MEVDPGNCIRSASNPSRERASDNHRAAQPFGHGPLNVPGLENSSHTERQFDTRAVERGFECSKSKKMQSVCRQEVTIA